MLWVLMLAMLILIALFVVAQLTKPQFEFTLAARAARLPPCTIRPLAGAADVDACEEIYARNEPGRFPESARPQFLDFIRKRDKALFLVAELEGAIVGFGGLTMDRKGKLEYAHLVFGMVDPAHQGRGIGTALLLARMAVLPLPRRWWTVLLVPIGGSQTFYQRFGFEHGQATATARGEMVELYRTALTPGAQAQCIAGLADRLQVEPRGRTYIPSLGVIGS